MIRTGKEYATALFELACESRNEGEILESLEMALGIFEETEGLGDLLRSYSISKKERVDILKNAFETEVPEFVMSFLCILCEHEEINLLRSSVEEYRDMYLKKHNISEAVVTSAAELTSEQKKMIWTALERKLGRNLYIEYRVDASLIGGVAVEVDGVKYDGSLERRMKSIKKEMQPK